jgi:hypothetical protein
MSSVPLQDLEPQRETHSGAAHRSLDPGRAKVESLSRRSPDLIERPSGEGAFDTPRMLQRSRFLRPRGGKAVSKGMEAWWEDGLLEEFGATATRANWQ